MGGLGDLFVAMIFALPLGTAGSISLICWDRDRNKR